MENTDILCADEYLYTKGANSGYSWRSCQFYYALTYGEHVNDHQVDFCRKIEERIGNIIVVEDVGKIMEVIENYEEYCAGKNANEVNHNKIFNESLEALISKFKL